MLRRSAGAPAGAALDALYCALVGIALFLFAASAPVGGLGIWELGMALLGFLLYMHHFSRFAQPPLTALACAADAFRARVMGAAKKYSLRAIFLFQKVKGCFIIKKRAPDDVREGSDAEP